MNYKKVIAAFAAVSLLLGGCGKKSGPEEKEPETEPAVTEEPQASAEPAKPSALERAQERLAAMNTEEKAAQLIHMAVRTWNEENVTEMNDEVHDLFVKYNFGGICLFRENITPDNAMTIRLTQAFQQASTENGGIPLLISADQEGGYIYRLTGGTVTPGNMALAAGGSPDSCMEMADIIGSELSALGFNTNFAPDADVNSNPANPVIGVRSFSDDPKTVAQYTEKYVEGLNANNVIASLKHFPGHGDTAVDSHTGLPLIDKSKKELDATELVPFKTMVQNGYHDMIMTAHIQFPQIEKETYTSIADGSVIGLPATLSKTFLTDIVRGELGFEGVVITDSMIMDAIKEHFDTADSAALALNAGADMLLMPVDVTGTDSLAAMDAYMADLVGMIEDGTIPMARVDEAVTRILTLKYEKGIMDREYNDDATERLIAGMGAVGSYEHIEKEIETAAHGVAVLENNGALPLKTKEGMHIILCGINAAQSNALGYGFNRLQTEGVIPESAEAIVIDGDWSNNYGEVYNNLDWADTLILTDNLYSADLINPENSDQIPSLQALIETAVDKGITTVALSAGLPYDVPLLTGADAVAAVFSQTGVSSADENFNPLSAFGPGIPGALNVVFGKTKPSGKLPVNLPEIKDGAFADKKAYSRGDGLTW